MIVSQRRDVEAVLGDPRFVVPPAPPAEDGMAGFRAAVSRFTNGAAHARRRRIAEETVARLDPEQLAAAARARATAILDAAAGGRLDVMTALARRVPLEVLCAALGVADVPLDEAVAGIAAVAAVYPPGADAEREHAADAALAVLLPAFGRDREVAANRLAVLVQACEATAGLIGNTLALALSLPERVVAAYPVDALVDETLRHHPPVRATRRQAAERVDLDGVTFDPGAQVVLDLASANRDPAVAADPHRFDPGRPAAPHLTFGYGPRACPGVRQATALAGAVVAAVLDRCVLAEPAWPVPDPVAGDPVPALAVPPQLEVVVR